MSKTNPTFKDYFDLRVLVNHTATNILNVSHDPIGFDAHSVHDMTFTALSNLLTVMSDFGPQAIPNTDDFQKIYDEIMSRHDAKIASLDVGGAA